jgi:hypothetical protein
VPAGAHGPGGLLVALRGVPLPRAPFRRPRPAACAPSRPGPRVPDGSGRVLLRHRSCPVGRSRSRPADGAVCRPVARGAGQQLPGRSSTEAERTYDASAGGRPLASRGSRPPGDGQPGADDLPALRCVRPAALRGEGCGWCDRRQIPGQPNTRATGKGDHGKHHVSASSANDLSRSLRAPLTGSPRGPALPGPVTATPPRHQPRPRTTGPRPPRTRPTNPQARDGHPGRGRNPRSRATTDPVGGDPPCCSTSPSRATSQASPA